MRTLSLRLPDCLHGRARERAEKEGISVNQLIATSLAEKLAALLTVDYLKERGNRGSRATFEKVLRKVRDRAPQEDDAR